MSRIPVRSTRWSRALLTSAILVGGILLFEGSASACVSAEDIEPQPLAPATITTDGGGWHATYWNNTGMFGDPALVRNEASIDAFYGPESPGAGINADNFSARWTRDIVLPADVYRFTVTADDGVRIFVDGQLILDQWNLQDSTTFVVDASIATGSHRIMVEYFEHTGDSEIRVRWHGQQAQ